MKHEYRQFYNIVMEHYREYGRHDLPWRKNQTPYRVAVSEFMLQQTQASRVAPFFKNWMKQFSSWKILAQASQSEVLRVWKGLGYNSRALRLQKLAQIVVDDYKGRLPKEYEELMKLPGIGPYTAGAIRAFAHNLWTPIIETNIRRIFIHHFFIDRFDVTDSEILEVINDMGEVENHGEWYEALMDYGVALPKLVNHNPNIKSKHYTKQSKFEGSDRQIRGKILGVLLEHKKISQKKLCTVLGEENQRYRKILKALKKEGFLDIKKKSITLR